MKILLLSIAHFEDRPGGVPRLVQDEAAALRDRGDDVWVLAPGASSKPEHEVRNGIHLLRYVPRQIAPWNPARRSGHQKAARQVLARHLPAVDAVHGHVPLPYLAALDFYGDSVRSVYDIHSPARMEMAIVWRNAGLARRISAPLALAALNAIEKQCLQRSGIVSAKSQFTVDCISRIHGRKLGDRIGIYPGWADSQRYFPGRDRGRDRQQLGWPQDRPVLFTLRRLESRMGIHLLIEAARILRAEGMDFDLRIGGAGPLRQPLEEQVRRSGLDGQVKFLGRMPDEMLPAAYGACDAFVLPTAELECFGIIAVEALLAGRPVLATPVGAIPEIVNRVEPQWLARSTDPQDIAALLRRFLRSELPVHAPAELHGIADRFYGLATVLPHYIASILAPETEAATASRNG